MQNISHFHLTEVENFAGFAMETAKKGEMLKVLARAAIISDQIDFFTFIDQISGQFLAKLGIFIDAVYQFLIIIHNNLSADIYVNDFPTEVEIFINRNIEKGELVSVRDVVDIKTFKFPDIPIADTDKVIYCFKVSWKFALFFDLARDKQKLDIDSMYLTLGKLYRYLSFQYVYEVMESEREFEEMLKDGWFPFVELISSEDFKILIEMYNNKDKIKLNFDNFIAKFDKQRIEKLTEKWWTKNIFNEKKNILQAGISAYLLNNNIGYINCIKTLLTEIEGIIRLQYYDDSEIRKKKPSITELLKYIFKKAKDKTGSEYSLLLPLPFFKYLDKFIYSNFQFEKGKLNLSRHSISHGVARASDYTKERALQIIFILDQIYFYI
jgi:hypothetical protein